MCPTKHVFREKYERKDFPVHVCGVIGPRRDGYYIDKEEEKMSAKEAEDYHSNQVTGQFST